MSEWIWVTDYGVPLKRSLSWIKIRWRPKLRDKTVAVEVQITGTNGPIRYGEISREDAMKLIIWGQESGVNVWSESQDLERAQKVSEQTIEELVLMNNPEFKLNLGGKRFNPFEVYPDCELETPESLDAPLPFSEPS
jgi:hypothetical protein